MERIRLSQGEKRILRELRRGNSDIPNGMDNYTYTDSVVSLTEKRLVASRINGDEVLCTELTSKGHAYINCNPMLRNPFDWQMVTGIAAIVAAVAATLALFVCCVKFAML